MWLQSQTGIHTTKFAAKYYVKKNTKNYLVQPTFQLNVKTNVSKTFLQKIDTRFLPANKLRKTFDRNIVKVS